MNTVQNPLQLDWAGIRQLESYLAALPDNAATLAGKWPVTLADIVVPMEFRQSFDGNISDSINVTRFMPALASQLETIAEIFLPYTQPLQSESVVLEQGMVEAGDLHFKNGWHIDGGVMVKTPGGMQRWHPGDAAILYTSGADFSPIAILVHATLELPPKFAAEMREAFDANIFSVVQKPDGSTKTVIDEAVLEKWLQAHAALNTAPAGKIIAFPNCVLHSSSPAPERMQRTAVITALLLKYAT